MADVPIAVMNPQYVSKWQEYIKNPSGVSGVRALLHASKWRYDLQIIHLCSLVGLYVCKKYYTKKNQLNRFPGNLKDVELAGGTTR